MHSQGDEYDYAYVVVDGSFSEHALSEAVLAARRAHKEEMQRRLAPPPAASQEHPEASAVAAPGMRRLGSTLRRSPSPVRARDKYGRAILPATSTSPLKMSLRLGKSSDSPPGLDAKHESSGAQPDEEAARTAAAAAAAAAEQASTHSVEARYGTCSGLLVAGAFFGFDDFMETYSPSYSARSSQDGTAAATTAAGGAAGAAGSGAGAGGSRAAAASYHRHVHLSADAIKQKSKQQTESGYGLRRAHTVIARENSVAVRIGRSILLCCSLLPCGLLTDYKLFGRRLCVSIRDCGECVQRLE